MSRESGEPEPVESLLRSGLNQAVIADIALGTDPDVIIATLLLSGIPKEVATWLVNLMAETFREMPAEEQSRTRANVIKRMEIIETSMRNGLTKDQLTGLLMQAEGYNLDQASAIVEYATSVYAIRKLRLAGRSTPPVAQPQPTTIEQPIKEPSYIGARAFGCADLVALAAFVYDYFANVPSIMIVGGMWLVITDVMGILTGRLKPTIPIILAILGALFFQPWYVGVFWSVAIFSVFDIPYNLMRIFSPRSLVKPTQR